MISVFYDKDSLYTGPKNIEVSEFSEYVDAYVEIMAAIHNHMDITVVTRNKQIYTQLNNLKDFYPREFKERQFSIREEFKEKYSIEIPEYITEQDLALDKTYQEIDFSKGESFENSVLRKYFDSYFNGKKFPFQMLPELCANISLKEVKDKDRIVLRKVFQHRIKAYGNELVGNYEKFVYEEFIQNFESLRSDIALFMIIQNYPSDFKDDILGRDMTRCMEHFGFTGRILDVDSSVEESYRDRATVYLNSKEIGFDNALQYVSGAFSFELDIVLSKANTLDGENIDLILKKFAELFKKNSADKDRVLMLKAPVKLVCPKDIDDIDGWMEWAIDNYLPYKFWLELSGKTDQKSDEYASMYGDWIFEHYDDLVNSYPDMIYKILPSLKDEFVSNEHSLMVVLDNFNYKFVSDLSEYLLEAGFNNISERPVLAMIPTETAISKRAFFTGEAYNENQQGYEKLVKNWSDQIGISMKYLPNAGALKSIDSFEEKVLFLNYLRIDEMLHENQSDSAQTIEYRIKNELRALMDLIVSTLRKVGREKDTDIYFIADHGSTKISSEQINSINPKYYKEKAEEADYRFIAVNDEDFENTKNAIGSLCYALDKKRYGTSSNYFIAKGYNRFIKDELKGYVHGGITPEESIVPFMHFAFDIAQCKDPEIKLGNDLLRYAVSTKLSLIVKNFNEFTLDNLEINISNSNIKYTKPEVSNVDGYGTCMIEIPGTRITKALDKKNNEKMFLHVSYVANGRKHSFTTEIELPMKSVQSSGSDLSDLF